MKIEEAIEILENGGWWDLLIPITTIEGRSDEDKLHQAIDMAISALRSMPEAGKKNFRVITQADNKDMDAPTNSVWISVKDQLPERFKPVLICREKNGKPYVEQGYKDVCEWWKVYGTRTKQVTHWMPLPEPPEEG